MHVFRREEEITKVLSVFSLICLMTEKQFEKEDISLKKLSIFNPFFLPDR